VWLWTQLKGSRKGLIGVLGALLALWIVPLLTRQIQDRSTARDLKTDLAEQMSSSVADLDAVAVLRAYELVQQRRADSLTFSEAGVITDPDPQTILDRSQIE
jgi:hypothetical protein